MAKIRKTTRVDVQYTMVHNECFRGLLGAVEVAILGHGLSHRDGWEFERDELDTVFDDVGKTRLEKALQGLRAKGFIEITKYREDDGTYQWEWDFTPDPNYAAERAQANPEGKIIDLSKPQVKPHPQNGVLDSPAETNETAGRTTPSKPEPGQPGDGKRGPGEQGSGLYKEEKNTEEDQSPPTPRTGVTEVSPSTPEQGGEMKVFETQAVAVWKSVLGSASDRLSNREKNQLLRRLTEILSSGCTTKDATARLTGVDKANSVFAAACKRLSDLEKDTDRESGDDPFAMVSKPPVSYSSTELVEDLGSRRGHLTGADARHERHERIKQEFAKGKESAKTMLNGSENAVGDRTIESGTPATKP